MKHFEKHKEHIIEKLKSNYSSIQVEKINKMPKGVKFITWSIGWETETDYSYKVRCETHAEKEIVIFCHIVTFLGLIIFQSLFFEQKGTEFKRLHLK